MAVTLKDIAEICGVDISTVSRALRDDPRVQPQTRKTIQEHAGKLGYVPNLAARNLVSGKTLNLWMIIPDVNQAITREPASFLSESLKSKGYDLLLTLYHHDADDLRHKLQRLSQNVADGAFVIPDSSDCFREAAGLLERDFPLVFIDRGMNIPKSTTVTTANSKAAADLAKKCLDAGADRFVILFGEKNTAADARLSGALAILDKQKIPYIIASTPDDLDMSFINTGKPAFLASSAGYISQLTDNLSGLKFIAGVFDNWIGLTEDFTHIFVCKQNFMGIAEQAAKVMLEKIKNRKCKSGVIEVPALTLNIFKS